MSTNISKSDTGRIRALLDSVSEAQGVLDSFVQARKLLDLKGHFHKVSIRIGNSEFEVANMNNADPVNLFSAVVPGREMMLLGAQRVLTGHVLMAEEELKKRINELKKATEAL